MKNFRNIKFYLGFTLVELLVVITILAILATIAFMSFKSYMSSARDSNRLATISNLGKGLDLYYVKVGNYPEPDNFGTALTGGTNSSIKQGEVSQNIARLIKMSETPLDPLSKSKYVYSIFGDGKYYQIGSEKENLTSSIINTTYADSQSAIIQGNYKMDPSLPSLIVVKDSVNTSNGIFDPNVCFVVSGGTNTLTSNSGSCVKKKDMSLKDFDSSLVGYWDMESYFQSGSNYYLRDLSGYNNNGLFSGGLNPTSVGTLTGGINGKGLNFNGSSNFIEISENGILGGMRGLSICNFFDSYDLNSYTGKVMITRKTHNLWDSSYRTLYRNGSGTIAIKTDNNGWYTRGTYLTLPKENKNGVICSTYNGERIKIYLNGTYLGQTITNISGSIYNSGSLHKTYIGYKDASNVDFFHGIIDDVKIYNRALTDEEIKQQAKIAGF